MVAIALLIIVGATLALGGSAMLSKIFSLIAAFFVVVLLLTFIKVLTIFLMVLVGALI